MRARELMSGPPVTIPAEASLLEAAKILVNSHVTAAPVVNGSGALVGMLSEADLFAQDADNGAGMSVLTMAADDPGAAARAIRSPSRKVADLMTQDVVSVAEDASLNELARLMTEHAVKWLPIVCKGKVIGMVNRTNLLRALITLKPGQAQSAARYSRDEKLRSEIMGAYSGRSWSKAAGVDVTVDHGIAHLWGAAPSDMVRKAYQIAAENVPGVKGVEVHMHVVPPRAVEIGLWGTENP